MGLEMGSPSGHLLPSRQATPEPVPGPATGGNESALFQAVPRPLVGRRRDGDRDRDRDRVADWLLDSVESDILITHPLVSRLRTARRLTSIGRRNQFGRSEVAEQVLEAAPARGLDRYVCFVICRRRRRRQRRRPN